MYSLSHELRTMTRLERAIVIAQILTIIAVFLTDRGSPLILIEAHAMFLLLIVARQNKLL